MSRRAKVDHYARDFRRKLRETNLANWIEVAGDVLLRGFEMRTVEIQPRSVFTATKSSLLKAISPPSNSAQKEASRAGSAQSSEIDPSRARAM